MNELINVNNDLQTISARELHERLNINSNFTTWFRRMTEYGFEEGTDFTTRFPNLESEIHGGQNKMDFDISIDMAKQICMIQRTPEGKQVRQYLIDLEKAWNTPEQVMARALRIADKTISSLTIENNKLAAENEAMKPKALFAESVQASHTTILIGELAKILRGNGVNIGAKRLFEWMRKQGYLINRKGSDWNMPTQRAMDLGLFKIKETVVTHASGNTTINKTTKVTGKGQVYFVNKLTKEYA
ncbi:phage antirepressor KilAC domain-containing protein [Lachnobacterium bovis]|uniref:phage antirepressor KilAC domain-containing protein n=1 Tax=Lachnobacterium bovis TaxID=140626 RepID=UPI0004821A48|nr:phage antirepressor KilAC domain-containing protein [Lachnobacterium bovis]